MKTCTILYSDKDKSPQETCMCYGWDCEYGWYHIIAELSYKIEALNIFLGKYGIKCVADQVKQKFGELRFYYHIEKVNHPKYRKKIQNVMCEFMNSTVDEYIKNATYECFNTCEICGIDLRHRSVNKCQKTGWIQYICEECAKKENSIYLKDNKYYQNGRRIRNPYRKSLLKIIFNYFKKVFKHK